MNHVEVDVTVIVPVRDEEESILPLAEDLGLAMNQQSWSWECVWVDDGSTDRTLANLECLAARDIHHRYVSFERNAGQSAALWAGFMEARGAILTTIDGDGQNDPADIPRLVHLVQSGRADMVNGYREKRQDSFTRKISSWIANEFRNRTTGRTVRDVGCSTRAFRRECVARLPLFAGVHRFLPTLVAMQGFKLGEVPVNHRPRVRGKSKYTVHNRLWVGLLDVFGILWLRKRAFHYAIAKRSG
jgi:dolichol-phosphate mannosyltransferase